MLKRLRDWVEQSISKKPRIDNKEVNVVYLGMENDIMAPLLLVPDLTTLYIMQHLDSAFSREGTYDSLKADIKQTLIDGSDENSWGREISLEFYKGPLTQENNIHYLKTKSTIINESDDGNVWRMEFLYDNIPRKLVFFKEYNFEEPWPEEIKNIKHILGLGAITLAFSLEYESGELIQMFCERTISPWNYYEYFHPGDKIKIKNSVVKLIKKGDNRNGNEITIASFK